MTHIPRLYPMAVLALAVATLLPGCPPSTEAGIEVNYSIPFPDHGKLWIDNWVGDVTVRSRVTDEVSIRATKSIRATQGPLGTRPPADYYIDTAVVMFDTEYLPPDQARIVTEYPDYFELTSAIRDVTIRVDYEITVPQHTSLDITVGEGDVIVAHLEPLEADEAIACAVETGNIRLRLPADSGFDVSAEVDCGEIDNGGFDFAPEGLLDRTATGAVAGGGADITLKLNKGDIRFEAPL